MSLKELLEDLERAMKGLEESSSYTKALKAHDHAMKNPSIDNHRRAIHHLRKASKEIDRKMRGALKKHGVAHPETAKRREKLKTHGPGQHVGYLGRTHHDPGALKTHIDAHHAAISAIRAGADHGGIHHPGDQAGHSNPFGHGTHGGSTHAASLGAHRRAAAAMTTPTSVGHKTPKHAVKKPSKTHVPRDPHQATKVG